MTIGHIFSREYSPYSRLRMGLAQLSESMMRSLGLLAFALCAATPAVLQAQSAAFTSEEREQGEAIIQSAAEHFAASLRDASSATFRNVFIGTRPDRRPGSKIIVCGQVNARNGYGGLTGFQHFIASANDVHVGRIVGLDVGEVCANDRVFDTRDYSAELRSALDAAQQ